MSPDGKRLIFGGRAKFGHTDPVETAPILYGFMTDRFPQLKGSKITHAWTGNVAFTLDEMPHMGKFDNMHYALGCNGSGVAMMSYLGHQTARKIAVSLPSPENRSAWDQNTRCINETSTLRLAAAIVERRSKLVRSKLGV
jgi:glycine/D-amino acid oxidase-like deaminating enzyme